DDCSWASAGESPGGITKMLESDSVSLVTDVLMELRLHGQSMFKKVSVYGMADIWWLLYLGGAGPACASASLVCFPQLPRGWPAGAKGQASTVVSAPPVASQSTVTLTQSHVS